MAKILLGDRVGDIRGSIGSTTYSRNTFANYIRNKTSPVNPNTIPQQLVRARFGAASQEWAGLTDGERLSWNEGAPVWTNTNVFDQEIGYTGFSLRTRLNRNRQEINEGALNLFVLPAEVTTITSLSLVSDITGGTLTATFAPAIAATHKVIVTATAPLSAGIRFVKAEFRKIAVLDSTDLSPIDLAAFYLAVFGALPPVGSRVFVEFKPILIANGQNAVPLKADDISA